MAPGLVARNSGHALFWQVIRALCLAFYLVILTRAFSPAQYGILAATLSLASITGLLSGGGSRCCCMHDCVRDPPIVGHLDQGNAAPAEVFSRVPSSCTPSLARAVADASDSVAANIPY